MKIIKIILLTAVVVGLFGCEKISNSAKNIQSDWIGLNRNVEIYSCHTGELIKSYNGSVRINEEDKQSGGTSILIDGKKLHTNMCFVIAEEGLKENSTSTSKILEVQ